jgi:hypothetical protein
MGIARLQASDARRRHATETHLRTVPASDTAYSSPLVSTPNEDSCSAAGRPSRVEGAPEAGIDQIVPLQKSPNT